jgi:hypothetical protein
MGQSISATQAGRLLYYKTNQPANDIKSFDNFKRKIYGVFKNLVKKDFIKSINKRYLINNDFPRKKSLFD